MANDARVVIVTDSFWRQRLNSDPNVLGRDLRVNGIPRKVVGVLPPDFRFLSAEARLYVAYKTGGEQRGPGARHSGGGAIHMIARLKPARRSPKRSRRSTRITPPSSRTIHRRK
jgi:hypothetical protein